LPSTTPESPPSVYTKLDQEKGTELEAATAALEARLQHEIDSRRHERFFWIFGASLLADPIVYNMMGGSWMFLFFFLLQVVFLIGMASYHGVERVVILLELIFNQLHTHLGKKN
jgi:hypothetical protein